MIQSISIPFNVSFGIVPSGFFYYLDVVIDCFFMLDISKSLPHKLTFQNSCAIQYRVFQKRCPNYETKGGYCALLKDMVCNRSGCKFPIRLGS